MISGIVTLLVLGLIFWMVDYFAVPEPFNKLIKFVILIVVIFVLLRMFGVDLLADSPRIHPRVIEREQLI